MSRTPYIRTLAVSGVIAAIAACVFVPTVTDLPTSQVTGYLQGQFSVSWKDPKVILYATESSSTGRRVSCYDPKWDDHRGHWTLPSDSFVEEMVDDPSTAGASTVHWTVISNGWSQWAVALDEWCTYQTEINIPYTPNDTLYRVVAGYDVAPDGTHYALFYDQLYAGGVAWRVGRHDNYIVGLWDETTLTAPSAWSTTPSIDSVRLSLDPAGDLIVGNEARIHLDPTTLAVTDTSTLTMPSGYTLSDFAVHEGNTLAVIDGATQDKLVQFTPSGTLDADAEAIFTWATELEVAVETSDVGTANDGCGTLLKVEVLGARPYSEDPGNHRAHQFWWTLEDCDPEAAGSPGF